MTHKDHKEWEERFDERFELESEGCSECRGFELIDKREVRYPKGKYHCEFDLNKIKAFIREELSHQLTTIQEMVEGMKPIIWNDDPIRHAENLGAYIALDALSAKLKEIKQ